MLIILYFSKKRQKNSNSAPEKVQRLFKANVHVYIFNLAAAIF